MIKTTKQTVELESFGQTMEPEDYLHLDITKWGDVVEGKIFLNIPTQKVGFKNSLFSIDFEAFMFVKGQVRFAEELEELVLQKVKEKMTVEWFVQNILGGEK